MMVEADLKRIQNDLLKAMTVAGGLVENLGRISAELDYVRAVMASTGKRDKHLANYHDLLHFTQEVSREAFKGKDNDGR
jgi:hypothetical protein